MFHDFLPAPSGLMWPNLTRDFTRFSHQCIAASEEGCTHHGESGSLMVGWKALPLALLLSPLR
jgi:hypothetical protein